MPFGLSRGDYFVEQAITSRYTYCLICHQHIDETPVVWYTLGDDHIFLHEWCAGRLAENLVGDITATFYRTHKLTVDTLVHLDHIQNLLDAIRGQSLPAPALPDPTVVDSD